ncbi:MAG: lipid II:glycine glycyltransferase FemX [Candidatus Nanogingivalis sp.]
MLKIIEITDRKEWDDFINEHGGHPLQLWGWGELKSQSPNWKVKRVFLKNGEEKYIDRKKKDHSDIVAAAQILVRKLPFPLRNFAYIPRGALVISKKPIERARISREIALWASKNIKPKPVCLTMEPDWDNGDFELSNGWRRSKNTILIPRTLILDLTRNEDELLAKMSKKTRQYIRKSGGEVKVRQLKTEEEIDRALEIYTETAKRARFAIHSKDYYHKLYQKMGENSPIFGAFIEKEQGEPTKEHENAETFEEYKTAEERVAEKLKNQEMVAFLWFAQSDSVAFELYGGITEAGQKARANYALKWIAIIEMKNHGVKRYDFNGLLNDGISKFKAGFANHEDLLVGTLDFPISKSYFIWSSFLPTAKKIVRKFKK